MKKSMHPMPRFLSFCFVLTTLVVHVPAAEKPNIIVIIADDKN